MKRYVLILLLALLILPVATAEVQTLKPAKQNSCINLPQEYANATWSNITVIQFPDQTIIQINSPMTSLGGGYFNYTFCNTSQLGDYIVNGISDVDGIATSWVYDFPVNATGRPEPSGILIVFFVIGFLTIMGLLIYLLIYSFGHAIKKDFDMIDLSFLLGIYFVLISFFLLQRQYLGSVVMDSILYPVVIGGAFINVLGGFTFLFISILWQNMEKQRLAGGLER